MVKTTLVAAVFFGCLFAAGWARAAEGGLRLAGRALVAVPQKDFTVFLTWRYLDQDGPDGAFEVYRSDKAGGGFAKVGAPAACADGSPAETTTFVDSPGKGTFYYHVMPTGGGLKGARSNTFSNIFRVTTEATGRDWVGNIFRVTTEATGRDWVEILPAARGKRLQFSDRHFADTDGDGELEFVTYYPQVPSYRGGTATESYKLQVYKLFDEAGPRWTFDTGMGTQAQPAEGDHRADWDYEWTFKPVAWDIDGDFKAEIITLAKIDGKYKYVVLKDEGAAYRVMATMDSPIPVADDKNNSRHFPFFADLGGKYYSFLLQGGTYGAWQMWAYDWNGSGFTQRWHVDSAAEGFQGNRSSSHTVLVVDLDGDGRDEINNGATVLRSDGTVLWTANGDFGPNAHVDGQVIDDIDPDNPGLELMAFAEKGDLYALYDARTGRRLWLKHAPAGHLQCNIAANVTGGKGLDILGVFGGHLSKGGFACRWDGSDAKYPYPDRPMNGDRWWPMDWDGRRGRNVCMNFLRIYGLGDKVLYEVDLSDAPKGDVIPWNEHHLYNMWFNVDIVGDYREDIPVQMPDGSVRVYVNTKTPPGRKPCKWQDRAYQMLQAPGDYRYFIRTLDGP